MRRRSPIALRLAAAVTVAALAVTSAAPDASSGARSSALGLEVTGNRLTSLATGATVRLLGVDRSGAEYECTNAGDRSVFDGPTDAASIAAIRSWHANAVRVPLNEDCWLGISGAVPRLSGATYRETVERYVGALNAAGLYVILDLHWAAPGSILAHEQWPMADADHAPTFWRSVADAFKADRAVIFDLYNEPFITSWTCWLHGCETTFTDSAGTRVRYATAGMQRLVDSVRSTGAANPIMLGGIGYANDESEWAAHAPTDPDRQLIVSFHTYNFDACASAACWNATIAPLARTTPVVTGEIGENGCTDGYIDAYMAWADAHGVSYLGWAWDATDSGWSCSSGPSLIVNYAGRPTAFGAGLERHLAQLAGAT